MSNFIPPQFWGKIQAYSLTFWPNIAHFLSRNFHAKMCPILYRLSFGQKSKPIALLFGHKLPIFVPKFLCKNVSNFIPPQYWGKIQAYSLTFWPNIAHFLSRNFYAKICPILYRLNFGQKSKPIAFLSRNLYAKICPILYCLNFGQKSKPIALLFGQKLPIFCPEIFMQKFVQLFAASILGKTASLKPYFLAKNCPFLSRNFYAKICPILYRLNFGQKSKPIALLFGQIMPIFCPKIFMQKFVQFYTASILGKNPSL